MVAGREASSAMTMWQRGLFSVTLLVAIQVSVAELPPRESYMKKDENGVERVMSLQEQVK